MYTLFRSVGPINAMLTALGIGNHGKLMMDCFVQQSSESDPINQSIPNIVIKVIYKWHAWLVDLALCCPSESSSLTSVSVYAPGLHINDICMRLVYTLLTSVCPWVAHYWHLDHVYALGLHIADILCSWVAQSLTSYAPGLHITDILHPWVAHHWHLYAHGLHITDILCPRVAHHWHLYARGLHNQWQWHLYAPELHSHWHLYLPLGCTIMDICMP